MRFKNLSNEIKDLIPGYLVNRSKEIKLLSNLLSDCNLIDINKIGHKLAGNAGSYGLDELGKIGERLEFATNLTDIPQVLLDYKRLLQSYEDSL